MRTFSPLVIPWRAFIDLGGYREGTLGGKSHWQICSAAVDETPDFL